MVYFLSVRPVPKQSRGQSGHVGGPKHRVGTGRDPALATAGSHHDIAWSSSAGVVLMRDSARRHSWRQAASPAVLAIENQTLLLGKLAARNPVNFGRTPPLFSASVRSARSTPSPCRRGLEIVGAQVHSLRASCEIGDRSGSPGPHRRAGAARTDRRATPTQSAANEST